MRSASMNRVIHFLRRAVAPPGGDGELLRRFLAAGEEAAFTGLVRRHGAMVLGVCRRVLDDADDADDAFQTTFLVLARKAAAVRKQDSLASWLYGVAFRVARKARAAAAAPRRVEERPVAHVPPPDPATEAAWRELRPVIDDELSRLPEKYRAPLVLCYLEGKTNDEAARLLGWTKGTVSGRLARARDLLRPRLARRGLALPAVGLAAVLACHTAAPAALVDTTIKAVLAGGATAPAVALAEGVIRAMFATQVMRWTAAVTVLGLATAGTLWHYAPAAGGADEEVRRAAPRRDEPAKTKPGVLFNLPEEPKKETDDLKQLQGTWRAVVLEHNGEKLSAEAIKGFKVAIDKGRVTFHSNNADSVSAFRLEPSSKPKVIWLERLGEEGETIRGIYALEDGRLKICVDNDEGKARPTEFATKPGSGLTLMVLEREAVKDSGWAPTPPGDRSGLALAGSGSPARAVAFSPDGKSVWACSEDGRVAMFDVATRKVRASLAPEDGKKCVAMAVSPDGKRVVLGGAKVPMKGSSGDANMEFAGWVAVYAADLDKRIWHHDEFTGRIAAVAFSPDGKRLAAVCPGATIVMDAETDKVILTLGRGRDGKGAALVFSPDGKTLAAGGAGQVVMWDLATGKEVRSLTDRGDEVTTVSFSPDGRTLLTAGRGQPVRLWELASGRELRALGGARTRINAAAFSRDGRRIAWGDEHGTARLYDLASGEVIASSEGSKKAVTALALSPDGTAVAVASEDGTVRLWDAVRRDVGR